MAFASQCIIDNVEATDNEWQSMNVVCPQSERH